jgi:hypothetical protein
MPPVSGIVQNFINGVSEQPAAVRLPTQVEAQINAYSTVVRGLLKRFPSRHVAKLSGFDPASAYLHTINRDATERYEAAFRTDDIDVVSLIDGASKTVNFADVTITSLDAIVAITDGIDKRLYFPAGTTDFDVVTTGITTATLQVEESTTGAFTGEETQIGSNITTNTTTNITGATSGRWYRVTCTAWTAGTITATITWANAGYLQGTPTTDFEALTVADYTFLVNKTITVASDPNTLSPDNGHEGLIHVVTGSYGRWYRVYLDGVQVANYQGPAVTQTVEANSQLAEEAVSTEYITTALWDGTLNGATFSVSGRSTKDLAADLTAGFTATRHGDNVIKIIKDDGGDFDLRVETDKDGDDALLRAHKGAVTKFSDLPREGPVGFQIKVKGDEDTNFDDYYVEFELDEANDSAGRWNEKVAPGIEIWLDKCTMPHTLVREADGTFTFGPATWDARDAGDLTTSPWPSFVGTTISNVSFFKNRLVFCPDENVSTSQAGEFFDFFRETITTVLDSDPVDVAISYKDVSIINHIVPVGDTMVLFSDQAQFTLRGSTSDDLFTPKTVTIEHLRNYRSDPAVTPVYPTQIREMQIADDGSIRRSPSVSSHCPGYLPVNFTKLAGSSETNALVGITSTNTDRIYVYKHFWSGQEKLQSSWSYFDSDRTILDVEFVDDDLVVITSDGTDTYIETIPFNEDFVTLPYDASGVVCVTAATHTAGIGQNVVVNDDTSGTTVKVAGDQTAEDLYFGFTYDASVTLSELIPKKRGPKGGDTPFVAGELTILSLDLLMGQSGYLTAEVAQSYRDTFTHTFTGAALGSAGNLVGAPALQWDNWRIPINAASKEITITLKSTASYQQFALLNAEWRGRLYRRGI